MAIAPGILLTFDDVHVEDWLAALPLFESHGARATFFVSTFDQLSDVQMAGLRRLHAAGHAVECHGWRHLRAADSVRESGEQWYLENEIEPALAAMRAAGFNATSFAYPDGRHDEAVDALLSRIFRHARGTGGKVGMVSAEAAGDLLIRAEEVAERFCLPALSLDGVEDFGAVDSLLDMTADGGRIAAFYGHRIGDPQVDKGDLYVTRRATLGHVLAAGRARGLTFHTFSELPRDGE